MNILIVEDEAIARKALASLLAALGYATRAVGSAELALERIETTGSPEIALVDLDLPGMSGLDLVCRLAAEHPNIFPVVITAAGNERVAALRAMGITHLRKPLDFNELLKVLGTHGRSH